jgi:hypothetical protein
MTARKCQKITLYSVARDVKFILRTRRLSRCCRIFNAGDPANTKKLHAERFVSFCVTGHGAVHPTAHKLPLILRQRKA